jgi:hypothetical protein
MERFTTNRESNNAVNAVQFEQAAAEFEQEAKAEVLSCNQLLKNLLKTNLKLLKLNELGTMLLF